MNESDCLNMFDMDNVCVVSFLLAVDFYVLFYVFVFVGDVIFPSLRNIIT